VATQKEMIVNYLSTVVGDHRPGRVFVFTSHAHPGHLVAIDSALEELDDDFDMTEFYRVFDFELLEEINDMLGEKRYETRGHAARNETMVMMGYDRLFGTGYVDLEKVKGDRIRRPRFRKIGVQDHGTVNSEWLGVNGFDLNSPAHILGNVEGYCSEGVEWIRQMSIMAQRLILNGVSLENLGKK